MQHLPSMQNTANRAEMLADSDHELSLLIESMSGDYTVLFYSDPNDARPYEAEFVEPLHMDLKRRAEEVLDQARTTNSTGNLPLFVKYQFFTPGIFMSLIVLIILLSILGVGLRALSSLEVSYGAFDKEMGPAAQKKQN
ncbi:hypothetical protein P8C59_006135 [Phyllachora maydis]|uniref:Protein BIG1 n=1 Tax=Phyllachora maydis TaxID=1825666 RepID=A0AAD9MGB1_9PEZI|nr:hypothetical protein P8C59_006135 [Phyllachora maydis]